MSGDFYPEYDDTVDELSGDSSCVVGTFVPTYVDPNYRANITLGVGFKIKLPKVRFPRMAFKMPKLKMKIGKLKMPHLKFPNLKMPNINIGKGLSNALNPIGKTLSQLTDTGLSMMQNMGMPGSSEEAFPDETQVPSDAPSIQNPDGSISNPDGSVTLPDGTMIPAGDPSLEPAGDPAQTMGQGQQDDWLYTTRKGQERMHPSPFANYPTQAYNEFVWPGG